MTSPRRLRAAELAVASALALTACADATSDAEPAPDDTSRSTSIAAPTTSLAPADASGTATTDAGGSIVVERLWSPENAIAEMNGTGAAREAVVTVDDESRPDATVDVGSDGTFTMRVEILDEGAHTVCVDDACGRVFTRAIDAESIEEVEAKIDEAITLARELFDFEAALPEWTIEIAGPMSGTGGTADIETKTIVIHANRNRPLAEYVVTVLHEWGHAVDAEWLTDDDRVAYRELRGIDVDTPWREPGPHSVDNWARQPSEDFAEVMAAYWTQGDHVPRTAALASAPDGATFAAMIELLDGRV
ncbi:MAG: hypothetical protein AAGF73_00480 [Actinomycetota bacterium]